jgi:hypothetical protein
MKRIIFLLITFLCIGLISQAQDKIFRKNGQVIKCKVYEVGTDEVKYKLTENEDGPIYAIEIDKLLRIEFANGKVEKFSPDFKDPEYYVGQRTQALKINFLSPLVGFSQLTYEKSRGVGKSYEVGFAVIGAGNNQHLNYYDNNGIRVEKRDQFGFAATAGYKFLKTPEYYSRKTRYYHIMQGSYAKPVFMIGHYGENRIAYKGNLPDPYVVERQKVTFAALQVELGRQWVFGEQFLLDFSFGLGYTADNKKSNAYFFNEDDSYSAYNYLTARVGESPGLSTSIGIRVGYLFK